MTTNTINNPAVLSTKKRLAFLLKDSALYGGAAAISKAFALVTFPLLAREFTTVEYGLLDYFMVLAGFGATIFIFGQDSSVARFFYDQQDRKTRNQIISQSLVLQLICLFLILPILWWQAEWLTMTLLGSTEHKELLRTIILQIPFLLLINFSQNLLKWTFCRRQFLVMSLGYTIIYTLILLLVVVKFDASIIEVLQVGVFTSIIFAFLGMYFIREWLVFPVNFNWITTTLPYAIPYGFIGVLASFSPTMERTMTNNLLGAEDLGLYAVALKIAMLAGLVVTAFQTAWGPFSLSIHKQNDASRTYNWVLKTFCVGICITILLITMLSGPLINLLASNRYSGAVVVVFPLLLGLAVQATSWITEIGISLSRKSYLNIIPYILFIATTLGSIYFFVPLYNLFGVGLGVMTGRIVKAIASSYLAQKHYKLPWEYKSVVVIFTSTMVFGLFSLYLLEHFNPWLGYTGFMLTMFLVVILGWGLLLTQTEKTAIKIFVRNKKW